MCSYCRKKGSRRDVWEAAGAAGSVGRSTHPPRKAPTGFRTGNGTATSANLRDDVWKLRAAGESNRDPIAAVEDERKAVDGDANARMAGESIRDAIVAVEIERAMCDRAK